MSNPDTFIAEVTDEIRRDRLFALMRRYGWIAILAVILIVGGATWREISNARTENAARAFGDSIMAALEQDSPEARVSALDAIEAPNADAEALLALLVAGESDADGATAEQLLAVAEQADVTPIYAQVAQYKALLQGQETLSADTRRAGFQALAVAGQPLRLLAEEQLALLEIETGETEAALSRLEAISQDAEVTPALGRRVGQLIRALGGGAEAAL